MKICKSCGKFLDYFQGAEIYVCCTNKCKNKGTVISKEQMIAERRKPKE
ncbi:hypothetical protein ACWKTZ_21525 [Bacillus cereus]